MSAASGFGGLPAIALAAGDRVLMLEHAIYSVVSPKACTLILRPDAAQASVAAEALRLTAADLWSLRLIDAVVDEPLGGAHRLADAAIMAVGDAVEAASAELTGLAGPALVARRCDKCLATGREDVA